MELWNKIREANLIHWLPDYLLGKAQREPVPEGSTTHILFMFADHWEPSWQTDSLELARERTRNWRTLYPQAARAHVDADGRHPQHSFFYPYDEYRREEMDALEELSAGGFGEAEIHLHHRDDTSEGLRQKLEEAIDLFRRSGHLGSYPDGRPAFGFVHGDWALDNSVHSGGRNFCGVNDELRVLGQAGCFADYTLPALGVASQPRWVNRIMRARDDPERPKSYERGFEARVGAPPTGDLMLIPGPMALYRQGRRIRLDDGHLTGRVVPRPERVDAWVRAHVHVRGRPEWVVVKLHTHGTTTGNCMPLLTRELDRLWTDLETRYNDGERYRLHYVTAREMYNILRAAEDGRAGDPGQYRDYEVSPPPCRQTAPLQQGRVMEAVR